jgi:hypothetical protein
MTNNPEKPKWWPKNKNPHELGISKVERLQRVGYNKGLADALQAHQKAMREPCVWTKKIKSKTNDVYFVSCEKRDIWETLGPKTNGRKYCPYCRKPIKEEK